jgi:arabinan endo-1,5-alpha-L-arabinosidase
MKFAIDHLGSAIDHSEFAIDDLEFAIDHLEFMSLSLLRILLTSCSLALLMEVVPLPRGLALAQKGDVLGVHDPCIIKSGAAYYVFSTHGGIFVRKSVDLQKWERDGQVLPGVPAWAKDLVPEARDLWAPDISFFSGKLHLYYSVSSWGKNRSCIGLATNRTLDRASPEFRWVDEGLVIASMPGRDGFNAIDPNVFCDDDGTIWLSFGSYFNGIQMVRLDPDTGKPTGSPFVIARRKGGAIEAPFVIRRGRYYYLFVSVDRCCRGVESTYKIMVGRSPAVEGPYIDIAGEKLLDGGGTLVLAGYGRFRGPGHNAVLHEGDTDYLVHHFYDREARGRSKLQIRPMIWGNEGWPLAGEPGGQGLDRQSPVEGVAGRWRYSVDFGPEDEIAFLPNGSINGPDTGATWRLHGTVLQLSWPRPDAPGGAWVEDCYCSPDGKWFVGRNQRGSVVRGVRDP